MDRVKPSMQRILTVVLPAYFQTQLFSILGILIFIDLIIIAYIYLYSQENDSSKPYFETAPKALIVVSRDVKLNSV